MIDQKQSKEANIINVSCKNNNANPIFFIDAIYSFGKNRQFWRIKEYYLKKTVLLSSIIIFQKMFIAVMAQIGNHCLREKKHQGQHAHRTYCP